MLHDIETKLVKLLKDKLARPEAKLKAQELIEVLKRNKDA
jgi:type I restriction enzyme R subunit